MEDGSFIGSQFRSTNGLQIPHTITNVICPFIIEIIWFRYARNRCQGGMSLPLSQAFSLINLTAAVCISPILTVRHLLD